MRKALIVAALLASFSGCSPHDPLAPTGTDVTGAWIGTENDANGARQFRYDLFQFGDTVSGGITLQKPTDILPFLGDVEGTMSGSRFTFTWTIPGGCSPFGPSCDLTASGTATVNGTTMTGTYSCSAHCTTYVSNGSLSLTLSK